MTQGGKIVGVIGGGFGGSMAVKTVSVLRRRKSGLPEIRIMLFEPKSHFESLPLLPDVAGERISAGAASVSWSHLCSVLDLEWIPEKVEQVELEERIILTRSGRYRCDAIIVATGAVPSFFGVPGAAENAIPLRTLSAAVSLQRRLLPGSKSHPDAVTVVGGGYTGVEAAVRLARLRNRTGAGWRVDLLQKAPIILPGLPEWMRKRAVGVLGRLGVDTRCSHPVTFVEPFEQSGRITVWAAGFHVVPPFTVPEGRQSGHGRVRPDQDLSIMPGVYLAGDIASVPWKEKDLPMTTYIAAAQARHAARNVIRSLIGLPAVPYKPVYMGFVVPLGGLSGFGSLFGIPVGGVVTQIVHYGGAAVRTPTGRGLGRVIREALLPPGRGRKSNILHNMHDDT